MKTKLIPIIILAASSLTLSTAVMADVVKSTMNTTSNAVDHTWKATKHFSHGVVDTTDKAGKHVWKASTSFVGGIWHTITSPFKSL